MLKRLDIVYFFDNGIVYPFLKECEENNDFYYFIRKILSDDSFSLEERNFLLFYQKMMRYQMLLEKGYSYLQIRSKLNDAKHYLSDKHYCDIGNVYYEEEALEKANMLYYFNVKKKKR